jgi:hypothetical protein
MVPVFRILSYLISTFKGVPAALNLFAGNIHSVDYDIEYSYGYDAPY